MIKVKEAIIVEGKYDKIKLANFIDGLIITTDGFGIFNNKEKQTLIRHLAQTRGILILTDSDGAGFVIRNFLKGTVPKSQIKNAYIPDIFGKEKRKDRPSKEGKLGVEGLPEKVIYDAILKSGTQCEFTRSYVKQEKEITKSDLFEYGLTGGQNSKENREKIKRALNLPQNLTSNSMLDIINCIMTKDEFVELCNKTLDN